MSDGSVPMPANGGGGGDKGAPDGVAASKARGSVGDSGGGDYDNPHGGGGGDGEVSGITGHGGQSEIDYHGGGRLGADQPEGDAAEGGGDSGDADVGERTRKVAMNGSEVEIVEESGVAAAEVTGAIPSRARDT